MNFFDRIHLAWVMFRVYRKIGGRMNIAEIIAAVEAAEQMIPLMEKAFGDVKVIVVDIENAITELKAKIAGVKSGLATLPASPPPAA